MMSEKRTTTADPLTKVVNADVMVVGVPFCDDVDVGGAVVVENDEDEEDATDDDVKVAVGDTVDEEEEEEEEVGVEVVVGALVLDCDVDVGDKVLQ